MGGPIHDKKEQMKYLQNRLHMVSEVLEAIDPEEAGLDDIDRLLLMLDDIELKCKQFRQDWEK